MKIKNFKKIITPILFITVAFILGAFYYHTQTTKQAMILEIEQENLEIVTQIGYDKLKQEKEIHEEQLEQARADSLLEITIEEDRKKREKDAYLDKKGKECSDEWDATVEKFTSDYVLNDFQMKHLTELLEINHNRCLQKMLIGAKRFE